MVKNRGEEEEEEGVLLASVSPPFITQQRSSLGEQDKGTSRGQGDKTKEPLGLPKISLPSHLREEDEADSVFGKTAIAVGRGHSRFQGRLN